MDDRLKKRIYAFMFAGALNLILGMWVLTYGDDLDPKTRMIMMFFFFGFAAVDFWFPVALKKKYEKEKAEFEAEQLRRGQAQQAAGDPGSH